MSSVVEKSLTNCSLTQVDEGGLLPNSASRQKTASCSNCSIEASCRRRVFSEQAWTVLLMWNEITPQAVDQPICDECYQEIREILIDRSEEVDSAMQETQPETRSGASGRKSPSLAG